VGLVIGDVVGRGFKAAAMMGQLRSALLAYALDEASPMTVVTKLNVLLRQIDPGSSATLLYIVFDPDSGRATMASAAHPPPLLLDHDGERRFVGLPAAAPLGVAANTLYDEVEIEVESPARLVLYSDGLVERPGESLDDGLERLRRVVPGLELTSDAACDQTLRSLLPNGGSSDDTALLVMDTSELAETLSVTLPAESDSPPLLRRLLRRWLRERGASTEESDEIVLACAEASANAIEHAYPPEPHPFRVEARVEGGSIVVSVRDWGKWRPPRGDFRGRGMVLMEGLTDSVEVTPSDTGTTVTLTKRLLEAGRV
jgi:anti-sigma regulatory factor (Ser/Thr protein kinase)